MIDDYFAMLRTVIDASVIVRSSRVTFDRRSDEIGYVRGDLFLIDDSRLHFREFVRQVEDAPAERYTYAYHYQRPDGTLLLRYDDAPTFLTCQTPHITSMSATNRMLFRRRRQT